MNWYLRTLTPAAELKSWLQWHLPPIVRVLPHKQMKQLYLFLSPLHFTPMTLHLHLSFVSLSPATPLPWQPAGCHLYANTCEEKKEKKCFSPFEKQTQPHNLAGVPLLHLIGLGLQRDSGLLSPIMGWGLTETVSAQWWLMGRGNKVDSVRMELCREGYRGGGAWQNKPKLQLHSSGLLANGKRMLRVLFTQFPYIWIKISLRSPQGCCRLIYINRISTINEIKWKKWNEIIGKLTEVLTPREGCLAQSGCQQRTCSGVHMLASCLCGTLQSAGSTVLQSIKGPFCRACKLIYVCQLLGICTQASRGIMLFKKTCYHM